MRVVVTRWCTVVNKTYPVMEIFGPTIQGEGAVAGKPTHFVRFGGCDNRCHWCDTEFSVLPEKVRENAVRMTEAEIAEHVFGLSGKPEWVTLSGGNPAMMQLTHLIRYLHDAEFKVAVETQGTIWREWLATVDQLTISPKAPSSLMQDRTLEMLPPFMAQVLQKAGQANPCLKVPVFDRTDFEYAKTIKAAFPQYPFYLSIVTRMGGLYGDFDGGAIDTLEDLGDRFRRVAEWTAHDPLMGDATVIPQLHVFAWGHKRGV